MRAQYKHLLLLFVAVFVLLGLGIMWYPLPAIIVLLIIPGVCMLCAFPHKKLTTLEKLLASIALTNVLHIILYACALINIPVTPLTMVVIYGIIPALVALANKERFIALWTCNTKLSFKKDWKTILKKSISIILILLVFIIIYHRLFGEKYVPSTDAILETWQGYDIGRNIRQGSDIYMWTSQFLIGYPRYVFEGFFSYFELGTLGFLFGIHKTFLISNLLFFVHLCILSFGIYALSRRMGANELTSGFAALLPLMTKPALLLVYAGHLRQLYALSFFPILLCIMWCALKDPKYFVLISFVFTTIFFNHPLNAIIVGLLIGAWYCAHLFMNEKHKLTHVKKTTLWSLPFVGLSVFWFTSFIVYKKYMQPGTIGSYQPLDQILGILKSLKGSFVTLDYMILLLIVVGAIAFCIHGKKEIRAFFIGPLCAWIIYLTPLGKLVNPSRLPHVLILYFAVGVAGLSFLADKNQKKWILLILAVLLVNHSVYVYGETQLSIREATGNVLANLLDRHLIATQDAGRVGVFGDYVNAVSPLIQIKTNHPTIDYGLFQGQHMDIYLKVRTGRWFDDNIPYVLNVLRSTYTKYMYIYYCNHVEQAHELAAVFQTTSLITRDEKKCKALIEIPDTHFAEITNFVKTDLSEKEYYSLEGSWKAHTSDTISTAGIYTVANEFDLSALAKPQPLGTFRHNEEEILLSGNYKRGDTIVVKEQYFPRWKAYQSGRLIPVHKSNLGTMLIRPLTSEPIELSYTPDKWEIMLTLLSVLTLLGVMIFLTKTQKKRTK